LPLLGYRAQGGSSMQWVVKWLRGLGPIGSTAADILTFLTNNWVLTMSTIIALWASFTDWAVAMVQNPKVQTAALVFLVLLWTIVGITVLIDRRKPRITKSEHDYRYGLTFEGFVPLINDAAFDKDDSQLRFGISVRNFSSGPIKYTVDELDVRIGNRALPKLKKGELFGFMARGAGRTSASPAFKRGDFKELIGQQLEGTANFSISYGHPELPPVRRLLIVMTIVLHIPESGIPGFGTNILEETDQALNII
jgi:hypothetical protein